MPDQLPDASSQSLQPSPTTLRRVLRILKRLLLVTLMLIVVLMVAGFTYEQAAQNRAAREFPPPGELIDIGGRDLHLEVRGKGSPTVILEAGLGALSLNWSLVAPEVAEFTRVVSYDRAGLGWSDPGTAPRDAQSVVADLYAALKAKRIEGPYVLVGHSMGGIHMRMFYYLHPDEVVGMLLVDSSHEQQRERLPGIAIAQLDRAELMVSLAAHAARFGIPRLVMGWRGEEGMPNSLRKLPKSARDAWLARGLSPTHLRTIGDEFEAIERTAAQATEAAIPWNDLPLVVLSAGRQPTGPPESPAARMAAAWRQMQKELASRSTQGRHRVVVDSGHSINVDRPDVIIEEIRGLVLAAR